MIENNGAYFRQRAQYHLTKSARAEQGVACIHRRFAKLYVQKAMSFERTGSVQQPGWLHAPDHGRSTMMTPVPSS